MNEPILEISSKKYTGDSAVVSIRMPKDMLKDIDTVAQTTGRTRNEVFLLSTEFALKHMIVTEGDEPFEEKEEKE